MQFLVLAIYVLIHWDKKCWFLWECQTIDNSTWWNSVFNQVIIACFTNPCNVINTCLITEILVNIWVGLSTQNTLWLYHNWSQQVLMYSGTWDTTSSIQDWILIVHFALQLFMYALFLAFSSSDALDAI